MLAKNQSSCKKTEPRFNFLLFTRTLCSFEIFNETGDKFKRKVLFYFIFSDCKTYKKARVATESLVWNQTFRGARLIILNNFHYKTNAAILKLITGPRWLAVNGTRGKTRGATDNQSDAKVASWKLRLHQTKVMGSTDACRFPGSKTK